MKKIFILLASVLLASCSTSNSALSDLRSLSEQINAEGSTYGLSEWKSAAVKYYNVDRKIADYTAKGAYSDEQLEEIGQLQGSCLTAMGKGAVQKTKDTVKSAASFIKGVIEGIKDGLSDK